jgi:AcrR family transcriptional regulator
VPAGHAASNPVYRLSSKMSSGEPSTEAPAPRAPRRYRGLSVEERRAQRRERLLEAGLELFGTEGYAGSSIRAVSAAASLNSRYFYESFSSREDLLYHVYRGVVADIATAVIEATAKAETVEDQARAGLRAAWMVMTDDRRKARVIVLEVVGVSERLERLRRENRHAFADILVNNAMSIAGDDITLRMDPLLSARALIGAGMELLVDWIHGDVSASPQEIVEHLTKMYTAVALASVAAPDGRE